ncbi:unnamed protein product [Lymnaea stagnalis]|uniref:Oxidoreductase NAD-binding domain-containing protein 1 n=1 Tax=Lymnaea stagnalis TaxID=6523 RepID=A0AAV2H7R8_LYMST
MFSGCNKDIFRWFLPYMAKNASNRLLTYYIGLQQMRYYSIIRYTLSNCQIMKNHSLDHADTTGSNARHEIIASAEVKNIDNLSNTVKLIKFFIKDEAFSFKAGQWVDMFIPGISTVGGFSMCSPPHVLRQQRMLHLAVKYSQHPPAQWIHTECKVGDQVQLKAGGDFFYSGSESSHLLLIGGGVGINPLFSMLQHFIDIHPRQLSDSGDSGSTHDARVSLLYSAQNKDELIFKDELIKIAESSNNATVKLFCTREKVKATEQLTNSRIHLKDIETVLKQEDLSKTEVYICGPLPFIQCMETYCLNSGINKDNIHAEKWW